MANSKLFLPLNPPMGGMCQVAARTPGPLGYMDHADPNITSLLGDTPGPLGCFDHADPSLPRFDPSNPFSAGQCTARTSYGAPLALGSDAAANKPATKDAKRWKAWSPPGGYETLYKMLSANEGNLSHMYLDSKNKVTVGIGTYLSNANEAKKLRFYNRDTDAPATAKDIEDDYKAVVAAKPDPKVYPKGKKAASYKSVTKLDMTPTDIGERWLADVKNFQSYLPTEFAGFAKYPGDAKQALTDIAYQYGAHGAATKAAGGKLKTNAESGDWAAAAELCAKLEGSTDRNGARKSLFEAAAKAAPKPKAATPPAVGKKPLP